MDILEGGKTNSRPSTANDSSKKSSAIKEATVEKSKI
jgi:hypothetical protein